MKPLYALLVALCLTGCAALAPEVQQALEDPTVLADLRTEIAALPEGHPTRVALEKRLEGVKDAQTLEDLIELGALTLGPAGAGVLLAWRLLKRRIARSETALRQVVTGVEGAPKSPELKASLAMSTDEESRAVIEAFRAALPKTPDKEVPAVVEK